MSDKNIGKPVPRKEGRAKVTGAARYVDDLDAPGMLYGATVRSHVPRGRVREIVFGEGVPWGEFTVVTARDIPGANAVALILNDQPYLADGVVNHPEEPILLLAHEDKYLLEEARRAVRVRVEPLPAVFSIEDSLARKEIVLQGADFDLRVLRRSLDFTATRIFDTVIAARLLGIRAFSLAALVEQYFGVSLTKGSQKANWAKRPLPKHMAEYATNAPRLFQ